MTDTASSRFSLTGRTRMIHDVKWFEERSGSGMTWWAPCKHSDSGKQLRVGYPNGRTKLRRRCSVCFMPFGAQLPDSAEQGSSFTTFDAVKEHEENIRLGYELLQTERETAKADEDERWRADYEAHLLSPKWQKLRGLVMNRCGGICEGCMSSRATDVHHRTYANMGDELLFQLVGVCRPCHDKIHNQKSR